MSVTKQVASEIIDHLGTEYNQNLSSGELQLCLSQQIHKLGPGKVSWIFLFSSLQQSFVFRNSLKFEVKYPFCMPRCIKLHLRVLYL